MTDLPFSIAALLLVLVFIVLEYFLRKDVRTGKRIEELRTEIEAMKWEISSLEKLKSDLLTRVGSSLRQPLAQVKETALELARPLDSSPELNRQMSRLTAEIDEIERFLNVLGEIAMLETMEESADGNPPLSGIDNPVIRLDQIVSEILQENIRKMTELGLSMTVAMDDDVRVRGNETYLSHAVSNLLRESLRYISAGGIVSIDLNRMEDSIRLTITYRGETKEGVTDSALGVELARQIINAHGGWLTEGRGRGHYTASLPPA